MNRPLLCRAISEWVATLGKKLLSGSLSSTPAPVAIFEARSHLQKIAEPWAYMDFLLAAAAATTKLQRLQLVVAWTIAGLRHTHTWQKPFNPVLGETWRAQAADGRVSAHIEQVSHHPPVARYTVTGPGFRMHGTTEIGIQVRSDSIWPCQLQFCLTPDRKQGQGCFRAQAPWSQRPHTEHTYFC